MGADEGGGEAGEVVGDLISDWGFQIGDLGFRLPECWVPYRRTQNSE